MVVATATTPDRKIVVVDLNSPDRIYNQIPSPLKYQSRCIAAFPDQQGFCLGSIEGRVAVHHVSDDATSTLLLPTLALTLSPGISARQSSPLAARALAARRSPLAVPAFSSPFLVTSRHQPPPPFLATTSSPPPSPRQSLLITRKPYPATPNDTRSDARRSKDQPPADQPTVNRQSP